MRVIAALGLVVVLSACGVGAQSDAHVFAPTEVPFGLSATTTTAPPSTSSSGFTPFAGTESTPVAYDLYFIRSGILVAVTRRAPPVLSAADLVMVLVAGPSPVEVAAGQRSALPAPDIVTHTKENLPTVTVDLARTFSDIPRSDRILALGQITLTLTARPGVTLVQYTVADAPIEVPKASGVVTRDPVSRADYSALLQAPSSSTTGPTAQFTVPSTTR